MKKTIIVVVRNDAGQILILEKEGYACLPEKILNDTESLMKAAVRVVKQDTGFDIRGLSQIGQPVGETIFGFSAYISGGRSNVKNISWVTPSLALKLVDLDPASLNFLRQCHWM